MSSEETVNQIVIDNKENVELLNTFSKEYFSMNNQINEKISQISAKLDTFIEEEKKKENVLNILDSKITAIELGNVLKTLVEQRVMLNNKYDELNTIIVNNNKKIEMISSTIKENKQIIDSIYKIVGVLDENINTINTTIDNK